MIELRLLGPPHLLGSEQNAQALEALTRHSKRLAILAYLAIARPRGLHRREKLLGLFWPELDEPHARNALSQALHGIRAALRDGAIVARRDEVGIANDLIACDVVTFERALDSGDVRRAVSLYNGNLLDGFFLSGAPEFDRWLEGERARLRARAADAAWSLAEQQAAAGRPVEAARWAMTATDRLPLDEAVARRLMTFLHGLGDRAAALRFYDDLRARFSSEYGLEPSEETHALAARIRANTPVTSTESPALAPRPARSNQPSADLALPGWSRAPGAWRRRAAWIFVTGAAAAAIYAHVEQRNAHVSLATESRFALEFRDAEPVTGIAGSTIVLSPDGSRLVYVGGTERGRRLYVRPLKRLDARPLPYTDGARHPFFSPDGESIGFERDGKLLSISLGGDPPRVISAVPANIQGASWGAGNLVVYATPQGLWRVSATGGMPRLIAAADTPHGEIFRWPELLPAGDAALVTVFTNAGPVLAVVSLETGAVRKLDVAGTNPRFVPPDHVVFARLDGTLLTTVFDPRTWLQGPAIDTIAEQIVVGIAGAAKIGVSRTGQLAYMRESDRSLVFVSREGNAVLLGGPPLRSQRFVSPRLSRDGKRLAVEIEFAGPYGNVWVLDLPRAVLGRITTDSGTFAPIWDRDGQHLIYSAMRAGPLAGFSLRRRATEGGGEETLLAAYPGQLADDVSRDGRLLLLERRAMTTGIDLWLAHLDGDRSLSAYVIAPGDQRCAAISPDGRWVAYVSNESGRYEVYVRAFPTADAARMISTDGGLEPRWAANGREIFYRTGTGTMMSATVETSHGFVVRQRRALFDDRAFVASPTRASYDVTPDGKRFLMIQRGATSGEVIVHLNWFAQQRR